VSIDVDGLKARTDIVAVIGSFVQLKKKGSEYLGLCPFHADNNPSFWVIPNKGFCHCFACGANKDVIEFIMDIEGVDFKAACDRLGAKEWTPRPVQAVVAKRAPMPERVTAKPPADAATPMMATKELGEPSRIWPYRDTDGAILGYVARYETAEGKQIRCWTWGRRGEGEFAWGCGHWSGERPLYGLERLAARPDAPVLIVEGEKAADAAQELLPAYVVMTWPGGSNSWHKADLKPLKGRSVLLWPDNDAPGIECMDKLAALLADPRGLACKVSLIDPNRMPDGFDAADWTGTDEELIAWAKPRKREYKAPAAPEPAPEPPPRKARPKLAVVDGNNALAPAEEALAAVPQPLSEDALADHFADRHKDNWRRVSAWDKWFFWNGDGWAEDREDGRVEPMRELFRAATYWPEAATLTPDAKRKMCRQSPIYASIRLAGTDRRLRTTPDIWDADPWMLGVLGGVVDLKTGRLLDASRDQCMTMRCSVAPENGAPELWLKMLGHWTGGDSEIVGWLRRFLGYALTGDNREQCMAFFYGPAQAGKGTILRTISGILGSLQGGINPFRSYHYEAPIATFMESRSDRHSTELAALYGKRLITSEEPSVGAKWDEGKLKWITGGSQITARFISRDNFSFTMSGKIIVAANHRPRLATTDNAIKRRLHVVPFEHPVADEDRDNQLDAKLREEWPRILHWLIEGCLEWQMTGLGLPERIAASTETYLESEDTLGAWLEDCCEMKGKSEAKTLYESYRKWAEGNGEHCWTRRRGRMRWSSAASSPRKERPALG
jgi:putative DNA primase/helicase